MKPCWRKLAVASLLLFGTCLLHAQSLTGCSPPRYLGILGHSQTRTMYSWLLTNPSAFPCFPPTRVVAVNQDSASCSRLLQFLPYYMSIIVPKRPSFLILWVGGPDAEQQVTPDAFMSCVNQFLQNTEQILQNAGLGSAVIVWPSINIDSYQAVNGDPNYLALVNTYNQILPAILSQYPNVVPVDVTTLTTGPDGWGDPNDQYIDFYPQGWQVVLPNFRAVIH
jgi:hypothetical protein